MRACRCASSPMPRSSKPDADGLAPCDIVIEKERIAAIAPAARRERRPAALRSRPRHRAAAPRRRAHPHRQGPHLAARAESRRHAHGRAHRRDGGPRGELVARRCAKAHGLRAALRLRARHRRAAHPYRQLSEADADLVAAVRRDARALERPHRACRRSSLFPIDVALNDEAGFRTLVDTVAKHGGLLGGLTFLGEAPNAENRRGARQDLRGRDRERPRSRFPCRRKRFTATRARSAQIADAALRHKFKGRIVAGHCCSLALADDNERATHHRQGGRGRHRGRVAADVQHVSAGPRTPAARRAGAASRRCTSLPPPASP